MQTTAKGTDVRSKSWDQQGGDLSQPHTWEGQAAQNRVLTTVLWFREDSSPGQVNKTVCLRNGCVN